MLYNKIIRDLCAQYLNIMLPYADLNDDVPFLTRSTPCHVIVAFVFTKIMFCQRHLAVIFMYRTIFLLYRPPNRRKEKLLQLLKHSKNFDPSQLILLSQYPKHQSTSTFYNSLQARQHFIKISRNTFFCCVFSQPLQVENALIIGGAFM